MEKYIKRRNINAIFQVVFFVVLIVIDQVTKVFATDYLKDNDAIPVIPDIVEFRYLENTGAAFGTLKNAFWLFYVLTAVIFIVILVIWLTLNRRLKTYAALADTDSASFKEKTFKDIEYFGYLLAALSAGAVGNFIDRINTKYVVDFIYFKFIDFPIFNFADICVTVSVILICIFLLFTYKDDKNFKLSGKNKEAKQKNKWERYTIDNGNKSNVNMADGVSKQADNLLGEDNSAIEKTSDDNDSVTVKPSDTESTAE